MEVIILGENEREYWDVEISRFAMVHPLNAFGWGKVRAVDGWQPNYYMVRDGQKVSAMMMVLKKRLPFLGFSIMYAPKGPVWNPCDGHDSLKALFSRIRDDARKCRTIFMRIDPNLPEDTFEPSADPFVAEGFKHLEHRWSLWNSPRDVYRVDMTKVANADELFNTFDKDVRRCIRKAQNEGVTIRPAENLEDLKVFYEIFSKFSVGKGFMSRDLEYQVSLWEEFIAKGNGRLSLAIYKNEIIGGLLCFLFGKKCLAMHMGTPYEYHKLQTSYAYLWESIKWAKEKGCVWYSFRGIGSTPTQENFKRKFNPTAVRLIGYYDLPFKPFLYNIFIFCEYKVLHKHWHALMVIRKLQRWVFSRAFHGKKTSK